MAYAFHICEVHNYRVVAFPLVFFMFWTAALAFSMFLQAMITIAFQFINHRADSNPIIMFPPVTITVLPEKSVSLEHIDPLFTNCTHSPTLTVMRKTEKVLDILHIS